MVVLLALALAVGPTACVGSSVANPRSVDLFDGRALDVDPVAVNVAYGASDGCGPGARTHQPCGGSQTLDVYASEVEPSRGTIVYVHGGGFATGDKSVVHDIGPVLAQLEQGWDVVNVNYRLTNRWLGFGLYPRPLLDVDRAVGWVRSRGGRLGLDRTRIVVAGESAGGALAALIGTTWNSDRPELESIDRVDGYISIAGVLDAESGSGRFWSGVWANDPHRLDLVAAATHLDAADPPGWLIHGDVDPLVEDDGALHFAAIASSGGFGSRVALDLVDRRADRVELDPSVRGHTPSGGANTAALTDWLRRLG